MLIGAHMSVSGGVHTAFARAERVASTALQIFVKNANQWVGKPLAPDDVAAFSRERIRTGITSVIAHDSYLINLGSPDETLWKRSIDALIDELERSEELGLVGLVAHPGAHMGTGEKVGISRIAKGINEAFRRTAGFRTLLLLENTAGSGTHLGFTFEQLRAMREGVTSPERVGFCLDTCHMHSAGIDVGTASAARAAFDAFDHVCGLSALHAIHLNDSLTPFDSQRDRHAHLGEGTIGLQGFQALLTDTRLASIPKILETPKGEELLEDRLNLEMCRNLASMTGIPARSRPLDTKEWKAGCLGENASPEKEKKAKPGAKPRAAAEAKPRAAAEARPKAKAATNPGAAAGTKPSAKAGDENLKKSGKKPAAKSGAKPTTPRAGRS